MPVPQVQFSPIAIDPQKLLQAVIDVICVLDENGIIHYVSASCTELFGYTPNEMTGDSFLRFIHADDVEKTRQIVVAKTHNCRTFKFENRFFKKDGSIMNLVWSGRWDENDRLLYCVARDGSEQFETEQRLVKAQQMAKVANYEFDVTNNTYTYTSDTLFDILGLDKKVHAPFTSQHFWQLVHPDDLALVQNSIHQPDHFYSSTLEYRIVRPDGNVVYINRLREIVRDEWGNPIKTIGTIQDITDRKISELALQQSEQRFRSLVQNGNDIIGIIDLQGNYTFIGGNTATYLGYSDKDLLGKNAFDFIHPHDRALTKEKLEKIMEVDSITVGPFRFKNAGGEWRWVTTTVTNHITNPVINGLVINSKDITDRQLKENELALNEQRFKALVQNGSDLIVIVDARANLTYISNNVSCILGYLPHEIIGKRVDKFLHPDDLEKVTAEFTNLLQTQTRSNGVQHRFLHKNGSWMWLESKGSNHQGNYSIQGILINARNINDRVILQKRLNRELVNKQREITSAVIKAQEAERTQLGLELHDNVNQILTTVKLYNEMYLSGYVQDKALLVKSTEFTQSCINEIRSISKRLSAPTLGKISLLDSIKELADSINLTRLLQIHYQPTGIDQYFVPEDLHLAIYRIVQEGLNNIIKYSQAQMACIEINKLDKELCVKIWDDGIGFDTTAKRSGIGITNMKTRAESLNATFSLTSAASKGCEIKICFPLD